MDQIIQMHDVSKIYKMGDVDVPALRGVDMTIERGDFVALMGPSGSGKSTSMHLIGSLDLPTLGKIILSGQDIAQLSESQLAILRGKKIGFIFQQFNLIPNLTALDNVMLPMIFQGISRSLREQRAREFLKKVGLGSRLFHYPSQLSGGEMQRVAIARAVANDPEVILADEPTGNLDSKRGEEIMHLLKELNKQGKTIVVVTHDKALAEKYAKTIYFLKDGEIIHVKRRKK